MQDSDSVHEHTQMNLVLLIVDSSCVHLSQQTILITVDREIFTLKIIRVKIFHVVKFLRFLVDPQNFFKRLMIAIWMSAGRVPGIWSTTRY